MFVRGKGAMIVTKTKWPPFCRRHFDMHFLERKLSFFDSNSTEMCSLRMRSSCGPELVQIMTAYKGISNSRKCRLCPLVSSPFNILTHRGERPKSKTKYVNWLFIYLWTIPPPMPLYCKAWLKYRQTSNIRRTKFQNLNVSRIVLQLSLSNRLKPGVNSKMKM